MGNASVPKGSADLNSNVIPAIQSEQMEHRGNKRLSSVSPDHNDQDSLEGDGISPLIIRTQTSQQVHHILPRATSAIAPLCPFSRPSSLLCRACLSTAPAGLLIPSSSWRPST